MANLTTCKPSFEMRYVFPKAIVDGVPNPRHSGVASKVGIQYTDADVSLFFLADAFRFYQHYSAR